MTIPKSIKRTEGRIPLNKRAAMKCLDCAVTFKEVTLCHLFDCPLWAVRFGCSQKSNRYKQRTKKAEKNFKPDIKELKKMGIDISEFYKEHPVSIIPK